MAGDGSIANPKKENNLAHHRLNREVICLCSSPIDMKLYHVARVRLLYKLIFRVHRALPGELRLLGDKYAREEFKRHKNCNPVEAKIFLTEWTDYVINLAKQTKPLHQAKKKSVGKYLEPEMLDYMRDEQLVQLYELHKAASLKVEDESKEKY